MKISKKTSTFSISLKNENKIISNIDFNAKKIEAVSQFEISENLLEYLKFCSSSFMSPIKIPSALPQGICSSEKNGKEIIINHNDELDEIIAVFDGNVKKIISLIKYGLNQFLISDRLVDRTEVQWSIDNTEYHKIFAGGDSWGYNQQIIRISINELRIQSYLDNGFTPFLALKFLHRAITGDVPNFKILDATIAAELAIKEFLIRKNPELKIMLLQLPSPSLDKMYGPILENYGGERSPNRRIIKYGSEIRNKIIHSPNHVEISRDLAIFYCDSVQSAIYHLLSLLYPNDSLISLLSAPIYSKEQQARMTKELERISLGQLSKKSQEP